MTGILATFYITDGRPIGVGVKYGVRRVREVGEGIGVEAGVERRLSKQKRRVTWSNTESD